SASSPTSPTSIGSCGSRRSSETLARPRWVCRLASPVRDSACRRREERKPRLRALCLVQGGDQVALDRVEKRARALRVAVEEPLEDWARDDHQPRPLTGDGGDRRRAAVDRVGVAKGTTRPCQLDPDLTVGALDHAGDGAVDRDVTRLRYLTFPVDQPAPVALDEQRFGEHLVELV